MGGEQDRIEFEDLDALAAELERQEEIYKGLVGKDEIMKLLAPRPEGLPSWLNIPVVTLGKSVDLKIQADFINIDMSPRVLDGVARFGGIIYDSPHLIWMSDGRKYAYKSGYYKGGYREPNLYRHNVLDVLNDAERLATHYDGVALAIVCPRFTKILQDHELPNVVTFGSVISGTCEDTQWGERCSVPYFFYYVQDSQLKLYEEGDSFGFNGGALTCSG